MDFYKKLFFDGGMGTELQKLGISGDPVVANITHPQAVTGVHRAYVQAGANIITANTFGAYCHKHGNFAHIIEAAMANAKAAVNNEECVVLDLGPTGLTLEPYGDTTAQELSDIFAQTIKHGVAHGADAILIETMMDLNELEIAISEAEKAYMPILVTMSFDPSGRTMYGASIADLVKLVHRQEVDAVGINCGQGLAGYKAMVEELVSLTNLHIIVQPNAGLPEVVNGAAQYNLPPSDFAQAMEEIAEITGSMRLFGGCCGTTPAHIAAVVARV